MKYLILILAFSPIVFATLVNAQTQPLADAISENDWPGWRGPNQDGVAPAGQQPPTTWSESQNVAWKTAIPGRGHGSPTVLGDEVFLATASKELDQQRVLCFDRATGKQKWSKVVHDGGVNVDSNKKANEKASLASSTIATDSRRLYINFLNAGAVHTTALSLSGDIVWQQKITSYVVHQGYGSSPKVYGNLVLVSADNKSGGAVAGLDRETGSIVWRRDRPEKPNYASPIVVHVDRRDQLIMTGCDLVTSLDPSTGEELWEISGATTECVTSTLTDGTHIFTSGGYPKNHVAAVVADGSGKIAWEINTRNYVPSMVYRDGHLYMTLDSGVAVCVRSRDGKQVWKARLGGTFSSSPVIVGDQIYATNEEGVTHIFKVNPKKFEKVAENELGESVFATPAICGGQILMRVAHDEDGKRQEYLYCLSR